MATSFDVGAASTCLADRAKALDQKRYPGSLTLLEAIVCRVQARDRAVLQALAYLAARCGDLVAATMLSALAYAITTVAGEGVGHWIWHPPKPAPARVGRPRATIDGHWLHASGEP